MQAAAPQVEGGLDDWLKKWCTAEVPCPLDIFGWLQVAGKPHGESFQVLAAFAKASSQDCDDGSLITKLTIRQRVIGHCFAYCTLFYIIIFHPVPMAHHGTLWPIAEACLKVVVSPGGCSEVTGHSIELAAETPRRPDWCQSTLLAGRHASCCTCWVWTSVDPWLQRRRPCASESDSSCPQLA